MPSCTASGTGRPRRQVLRPCDLRRLLFRWLGPILCDSHFPPRHSPLSDLIPLLLCEQGQEWDTAPWVRTGTALLIFRFATFVVWLQRLLAGVAIPVSVAAEQCPGVASAGCCSPCMPSPCTERSWVPALQLLEPDQHGVPLPELRGRWRRRKGHLLAALSRLVSGLLAFTRFLPRCFGLVLAIVPGSFRPWS